MSSGEVTTSDLEYGSPGRFRPGQFLRVLRQALGLVWSSARRHALVVFVLQIVSGLALAAQLFAGRGLLAQLTDRPSSEGSIPFGSVAPYLIAFGIVLVVQSLVGAISRLQESLVSELTSRRVLGDVIDTAIAAPYESFEDPTFYDRLRRARAAGTGYVWTLVWGLLGITSSLIAVVAVAAVVLASAPLLLPLAVVAYLPLVIVTLRNGRAQYRFSHELTSVDRERDYLTGCLTDKAAAKELRVFAIAPVFRGKFEALSERRFVELRNVLRNATRRSLFASIVSAVVTVGAALLLVWEAARGRITVADAGVAAIALQQLTGRLSGLNRSAGTLYECSLFLTDFVSFVRPAAATGAVPADVDLRQRDREPRTLEVRELAFTYPGTTKRVLDDVAFTIEPGEVVALVGENGSGKTTLAKLLAGLYRPTKGAVLWNDEPVADRDRCDHAFVSVIFQDFVQYELSARENIAVGRPNRVDDDGLVRAAANRAGAERFLDALPNGLDTRLSRSYAGGADLSVGQWQRVALARAFFADRPFLVLDEPTAALDARAEAELFASMRGLYEGRSVLLISHRFSSVMTADRILVLKQGRLVEQGTHAELMTLDGHYAELFRLQASAYLDASAP